MTLEMIEKELRRHPLWEREIPIQMQTGIPYLYLENGALYLRYLLHRRIFRPGRVLIFPDRYELELLLPEDVLPLPEDEPALLPLPFSS